MLKGIVIAVVLSAACWPMAASADSVKDDLRGLQTGLTQAQLKAVGCRIVQYRPADNDFDRDLANSKWALCREVSIELSDESSGVIARRIFFTFCSSRDLQSLMQGVEAQYSIGSPNSWGVWALTASDSLELHDSELFGVPGYHLLDVHCGPNEATWILALINERVMNADLAAREARKKEIEEKHNSSSLPPF